MATNNSLKNQLANRTGQASAPKQMTLKALLASPSIKQRLEETLKDRAPQFTTSLLSLYSNERMLQNCEAMSIVQSAMTAAALDLPVEKSLGYAYIVPYGTSATFLLGYKGIIQLALRSGQYRYINAIEIYEGELVKWDRLTEELAIDESRRASDVVIGYAASFELLNGFKKTVYWTKEQVIKHRDKYSKSKSKGPWVDNFDSMALKTVLRNMLSKWGILSVQMQQAFKEDEHMEQEPPKEIDPAEIVVDGVDTETGEIIDVQTDEAPDTLI